MTMAVEQIETGILGLDKVLAGGYLVGVPTLILGEPGCGKTLFLLEFAAAGARQGQRTVFATCGESPERLTSHLHALGHPVDQWIAEELLSFVDLRTTFDELVAGPYNLDAVKVRIDSALRSRRQDPKRVRLCIDELNRLAYAVDPQGMAREATLSVLRLLRDSSVTTLIAMGIEDLRRVTPVSYAVDTVIELRQVVEDGLMTRVLRVPKMRGVGHGTNSYPFLIDGTGPKLMPVTGLESSYRSREGMVSTGHARLDELLGGGVFRGSATMITGSSGTGKSTLLAQITVGLCTAGMTGQYLTFEQDGTELCHDFMGVGLDVKSLIDDRRLEILQVRSVDYGLEEHLIRLVNMLVEKKPDFLIIDAVTALTDLGQSSAVKGMLLRLVDVCKCNKITLILTELIKGNPEGDSDMALSSLLDVWIRLDMYRQSGEFVRLIRVVKGRGAATSPQLKEFRITSDGIHIEDPYIGSGTFVFGTDKLVREQLEAFERNETVQHITHLRRQLDQLPKSYDSRVTQIEMERETAIETLRTEISELERRLAGKVSDSEHVRLARGGSG